MSNSLVTPWTIARQVPLSMRFPGQEYWSGLPFPSPGGLLDLGIEFTSLALRWILHHWATWESPYRDNNNYICIYSVQFSHSVMSNSFRPHELQYARPPYPSPIPKVHPNSRPLSRWCHPTISSSVIPFSSCPQSFPASGSFQMSQLFASGGQSIGV